MNGTVANLDCLMALQMAIYAERPLCMMVLSRLLIALALQANPYLSEGRARFHALRYRDAEASLRLAAECPTSTTSERREAFDLLARSLLAQGRPEAGEQAYSALLATDPRAPEPRALAPTVRETFLRAKERFYPRGRATLSLGPSPAGEVAVSLLDPWNVVGTVVLILNSRERTVELHDGMGIARLQPGESTASFAVEARAQDGHLLDRIERRAAPAPAPLLQVRMAAPLTVLGVEAPQRPSRFPWKPATLGLAGAVMLGVGIVLSVEAASESRAAGRSRVASDTARLDSLARRDAYIADGLYVGATLAVTATLLTWKF